MQKGHSLMKHGKYCFKKVIKTQTIVKNSSPPQLWASIKLIYTGCNQDGFGYSFSVLFVLFYLFIYFVVVVFCQKSIITLKTGNILNFKILYKYFVCYYLQIYQTQRFHIYNFQNGDILKLLTSSIFKTVNFKKNYYPSTIFHILIIKILHMFICSILMKLTHFIRFNSYMRLTLSNL